MIKARVLFRVVCAIVLVLAVVEVAWVSQARSAEASPNVVQTGESARGDSKDKAESSVPAPGSIEAASAVDEAALAEAAKIKAHTEKEARLKAVSEAAAQDLEAKRRDVEQRENTLSDQDQRLKEREKEIDKKLKEMDRLRAAVSGELEGQRKNNEERVVKLVSVFETMAPKSAAAVFETLDDWLAVEVLKRMEIKRVAKVMNLMEKTRSAKLSEMLTGYYHPENDRKISSIKNAAGQAPVSAPKAETVAQAPKTAPANPQAPQNPTKKGGEK